MAIDIGGRDAALFASGAMDAGAGDATKHPTTRIISMMPIAVLMIAVRELPIRSPIQWIAVKTARTRTAAARGKAVTGCQRAPKNATAVTATYASEATLVSQSLGRKEPEEAAAYGWASVRLGLIVFGVINLLRVLDTLATSLRVNQIQALATLCMLISSVLLGVLFGWPVIARMIPDRSPAKAKAAVFAQQIAPFQVLLGAVGIAATLVYLLYRYNLIHYSG